MATTLFVSRRNDVAAAAQARSSLRFDYAIAFLSMACIGGLFLDGWAHTHGRVDNSFFTPWHAVLYSAWLITTLTLAVAAGRAVLRGQPWRTALPHGYGLSLVGGVLFGIAGVGDLLWHQAFGIELGVEALFSPPHLLLMTAMGMIVAGPLRAQPRLANTWAAQFPANLSAACLLAAISFFTAMSHPIVRLCGIGTYGYRRDDAFAAIGILVAASIHAAMALFMLRRGRPLPGAFTLIFGLNAVGTGFLNGDVYPMAQVLAFVVAGVVADLLCEVLRLSEERRWAWHATGFAIPFTLIGLYFLSGELTWFVPWRIHMWLGLIVMSGVAGLLLSYAMPPGQRDERLTSASAEAA